MHYVIIGNSTAAVGAIEGLRQADTEGKITVISQEKQHTYSRPLISYLLKGEVTPEHMYYRGADFYEKNGCTTLLGATVTGIDAAGHKVKLTDGQEISYDKLLVATGSQPFVPPLAGLESVPQKFSFMSWDDADALSAALTPEKRVFILGAGLIGLKCAEGIAHRVASIEVADLAPRILPSILDERGSALVQEHIAAQGVRFHLGQSVAEFTGTRAKLTGGETLEFDILVLAVGVRPNTALIKDAGGKVNRGVVLDTHGQTDLPDVYSAGDCTESWDITSGEQRILAILPNAYRQGECAGLNMAGVVTELPRSFPMNAIGFFGLHMVTAGTYEGEEYSTLTGQDYKRLIYKDNYLRGFILIGQVDRSGIYTALLREQTPLDSIDFDLIKEKPQLMAFSKQERAKHLGGRP